MSDIVKRLRDIAHVTGMGLHAQAADEIERLRAALAQQRNNASGDLVERVARAILEEDPTCDYDKCKERIEKNIARSSDLERGWWEHLHDQARAAIAVVRASPPEAET